MRVACVAALASLVAACETAGDVVSAINPANLFTSDDGATADTVEPPPGADADYPSIGSVPERPATPYLLSNAQEVRQALVADKEHARYTDQVIRREEPPVRRTAPQAASVPQPASVPQAVATAPDRQPVQRPQPAPPAFTPPPVDDAAQDRAPAAVVEPRPALEAVPIPTPQPAAPQPRAATLPQPAQPEPQPQAAEAPQQPRAATLPQPAQPEPRPQAAEAPQQPRAAELPQQPRAAQLPPQPEADARPAPPPPAATDVIGLSPPQGQAGARAAPQAATPSPAGRETPPPGELLHIATIYFPEGGARLTGRDRQVVDQVLTLFRDGGESIRVVGHASRAAGSADEGRQNLVNYKASLDRATAVAQAFVDRGVTMERIELAAVGAQEPRFSEDTAAGVAGNQRTEIFIRY